MEERILILAPRGRDAYVVAQLLTQHGLEAYVCADILDLRAQLVAGAGGAVLTEEVLDPEAVALIRGWLNAQPVWSDIPFVVLTTRRSMQGAVSHTEIIAALDNVVLVERPVHAETLASAARSALRARRKQYHARALLAEREKVSADLIRADWQKDQFLAMLAHELRNPLAPIRSAAEVLKHDESDAIPRVRWARQLIERQSQHLSSLLEDLLDVSRITTGKVKLRLAELDLNQLLSRAVDSARGAIDARQHTLTITLASSPIWVHADLVRLTQVFGNLLDNACKYTPVGGRIEVASSRTESWATVSISDNGVGIAPADIPHIFDLFNQSKQALDRAQGGLGIGLSVVRSILNMHDGKTEVLSAGIGQGTCFIVRLPVLQTSGFVQQQIPVDHRVKRKALDILIVDDNQDARDALAVLLELHGHRVRAVADGPSGIEACEQGRPDIVLLDIGLPGIDGYEVAFLLRQRAYMRDATIIAVTGYGQPEDIRRAMEAGFDHHMIKPVEPRTLVSLIDAVIAPHGSHEGGI